MLTEYEKPKEAVTTQDNTASSKLSQEAHDIWHPCPTDPSKCQALGIAAKEASRPSAKDLAKDIQTNAERALQNPDDMAARKSLEKDSEIMSRYAQPDKEHPGFYKKDEYSSQVQQELRKLEEDGTLPKVDLAGPRIYSTSTDGKTHMFANQSAVVIGGRGDMPLF